jgi:hypothetical protein
MATNTPESTKGVGRGGAGDAAQVISAGLAKVGPGFHPQCCKAGQNKTKQQKECCREIMEKFKED